MTVPDQLPAVRHERHAVTAANPDQILLVELGRQCLGLRWQAVSRAPGTPVHGVVPDEVAGLLMFIAVPASASRRRISLGSVRSRLPFNHLSFPRTSSGAGMSSKID